MFYLWFLFFTGFCIFFAFYFHLLGFGRVELDFLGSELVRERMVGKAVLSPFATVFDSGKESRVA